MDQHAKKKMLIDALVAMHLAAVPPPFDPGPGPVRGNPPKSPWGFPVRPVTPYGVPYTDPNFRRNRKRKVTYDPKFMGHGDTRF